MLIYLHVVREFEYSRARQHSTFKKVEQASKLQLSALRDLLLMPCCSTLAAKTLFSKRHTQSRHMCVQQGF